jgi:NADP-dependent 3-hydroxy acid dehydrogenase YdfG
MKIIYWFRDRDALVLNAGTFTEGNLLEISSSDYIRDQGKSEFTFCSNSATRLISQERHQEENIRIGSTVAHEAYPVVPGYGVAGTGLRAFTRNLRHELVSDPIGVTIEGDINE